MRRWNLLLALSLALPAGALAQDKKDEAAEPNDDQPFLEGDKQKVDKPPILVARPNDAWQFVDLVKAGRAGGTTKFHLWYGAARASIIINVWIEGVPSDVKDIPGYAADQRIKHLQKLLRNAKVKKKKRAKVGKRVGVVVEVHGEVPDRRDPTKLKPIIVKKAICFRPEDNAFVEVHLEYGDASRTKQLDKDFKKLLKKVRF